MLDVVVLISGSGSNLRALLEATSKPDYPARVVAVGSDRQPKGFEHARAFGIPCFSVAPQAHDSIDEWADELRREVESWNPDLVVCAGFMRILPPMFVRAFFPRLINIHPALLPAFPGAHAVRDALAAGASRTGSTVHLIDEGVDTGPVLRQRSIDIRDTDDEESLHARIKEIEHPLLVETVAEIAKGLIDVRERQRQ